MVDEDEELGEEKSNNEHRKREHQHEWHQHRQLPLLHEEHFECEYLFLFAMIT